MLFTNDEQSIIQSHLRKYDGVIKDEADCKLFMFNLEQHLAFKDFEEVLNNAENQVFYILLSNSNNEFGYPKELVASFREVLRHCPYAKDGEDTREEVE